tara:strand:- start:757 stop:1530 length:774 start_codon:yes stop_codon:yes gene_type:complete
MRNIHKHKRVVLICGSSKGIGLDIGKRFLKEGDSVIFSSRSISKKSKEIKLIIKKYNKNISVEKCDFSNRNSINSLKKKIINKFKKIDILVTNTGLSSGNTKLPMKKFELENSINQNLNTCILPVEVFLKNLIKSKGNIVAISSIAGIEFLSAPIAYSVSKSALNSFVKNISKIYGNKIRVNIVSPGNIYFEGGVWDKKLRENKSIVKKYIKKHVPQQKLGTPEDVANAVFFLSSEEAKFINGSNLVVDGGQINSLN